MLRLIPILLVTSLVLAGSAFGQALVLKDGTSIPQADFTVQDGKITRTVRIGDTSATSVLAKTNIAMLDWPYPVEIADAKALLAQGKSAEAADMLKKALDFHEQLQDIKGNFYGELLFNYVETLSQAGRFDETIKLIPQLKLQPLTDKQKMALKIIQLDIDRQTSSEYLSIMAEAENILAETTDSGVGAAIWNIIADIHAKKKEWEKALMAYMRIPVFYGSQIQRVPDAELKAGQMLVKMKRYEDATAFFSRIVETYPGSVVAEAAAKEKAAINGMKNEPEEQAENAEKEGETKTEGEKPAGEKPASGV